MKDSRANDQDAIAIDATTSEQRLTAAAHALATCSGVVLFERWIALRPTRTRILCEVIDPQPSAHRCAEEYQVLIENAARSLERSRLASVLPKRPLRWSVVDRDGTELQRKV